jgi:hypothetical protein
MRITATLIPKLHGKILKDMRCYLDNAKSICTTADAWTDLRMRSFFAVTAHIIDSTWTSRSCLLDCKRMKGEHTSENINIFYLNIIEKYNISDKISHIITDNAVNMIAAFKKTAFVRLNESLEDLSVVPPILNDEDEDETFDPESSLSTINDLSDSESTHTINDATYSIDNNVFVDLIEGHDRLSCVAHTLQLVIKDALKDVTTVDRAIEHVAKLIASANKSHNAKE